MFKKNLKKSLYLLVLLFLVGISGLFLALVEFNSRYEEKKSRITHLTLELDRISQQMNQAQSKLEKYDSLVFKADVFRRRDPQLFRISESVYKKSAKYGFEPELIWGVMQVESGHNPRAVSHRGAYGLMQINFAVWREELKIDKRRIFDIDYNIDLGLRILKRYYLESDGDIKKALHLYNNGYRYNNLSYVGKIKSQLWNLSLSGPVESRSAGDVPPRDFSLPPVNRENR